MTAVAPAPAGHESPPDTRPSMWWRVVTLWGLFGVGLIQPVLELYGNNPEVFIAARAGAVRIALFVALVTLAPALLCALVLLIAERFGRRAGDVVYRVLLAVAAFVAASAVVHQLMPAIDAGIAVAAAIAGLVVWAEARVDWVRTWLRILVLVAVAAPVLFLGFSDAADLVWEPEATADASVTVPADIPVVLLVFDELPLSSLVTPDGDINADLFPNFARLAAGSHWFENAQSNSIATTDSVPILVTGSLAEGARPTSRDHPLSLFTMLGDSYAMDVQETITSVCPNSVCAGDGRVTASPPGGSGDQLAMPAMLADAAVVWGHLTQPPAVTDRLPAIDGQWGGFVSGAATAATVDGSGLPLAPPGERLPWVDKLLTAADNLADADPGTLHYTHVVAPHIPWQANPSGTQYPRFEELGTSVSGVENGYWVEEPSRAIQGFQRHLFQLGLVDRLLGRILDALEESGLWDEGVIVVTADHGASFIPGEHRRWVTATNLNALYRVPLFIRVPGQEAGEIHDENAYGIDVLPTIVDLLDIELGPEWDLGGMSLFDPALPERRDHVYDHFTGYRASLGGDVGGLATEVAATHRLIPDQSSWAGVARVGPHAELIGFPATSLRPVTDGSAVAEFDQVAELADIDPATGIVPTVLTGRVSLPDDVDDGDVLVSVNGIVSGAGYLVRAGGGTAVFSAVVPEEAYTSGPNDVVLLIPSGDGGWIAAGDGTVAPLVLRDADGHELVLAPLGSRRVVIDRSQVSGDQLEVKGWSADTREKELPTEILVFFGDELVFSGPPNLERSDVPQWFDSEALAMSGFEIAIPAAEIPDGTERVTVVARYGDEAVAEYGTITS